MSSRTNSNRELNHDEFDENKQDFELLSRRRSSSAPTSNVSPASSTGYDTSYVTSTTDMIWPLHLTPTFVDHYIIGDVIGNGSYAEVRECVDTRSLERCALKIVNKLYLVRKAPRALANQLQEIRLLRHLEHPNVITMKEVLFKGDRIYISLELCCYNMDELLNEQPNNSLHVTIARSFFLQLCSAVLYLHSLGIVHRDIKPQNILFTNAGTLKLIDFGVSQVLSMWQREDMSTNYEGSPLFQAPEVVSGQKQYHGFKVDIWSCGVTLFLMLYGTYPFMDEALLGLYDKILGQDLEIPATLASRSRCKGAHKTRTCLALQDLLALMFEKDHAKRASIEQVLASPWCKLTVDESSINNGAINCAYEFAMAHSEFFDLVVRRNRDYADIGSYASSFSRDMYKSTNCLPYLYRHHFPNLPIKKVTPSAQGRGAIVARVNSLSSRSSLCLSESSSIKSNDSKRIKARSATSTDTVSTSSSSLSSSSSQQVEGTVTSSERATVEESTDEATSEVEWGTREQYQLMKVPQVRANRVRCGGGSGGGGAANKLRRNRKRRRPSRASREAKACQQDQEESSHL